MKIIKLKQSMGVGGEMNITTNNKKKNKIRESLMRRPYKVYHIESGPRRQDMEDVKEKTLLKL